jgi:hypothetical protein
VSATHRWPLLGTIYKEIYRAAADSVAHLAKQNPAIAGIYARNSYALGTWEVGRSDIDLTVVWLQPSQEIIDRFHLDYSKLQKRFPMLGEIEMIDDRHLAAWTRHGIPGLHSRDWKILAGDCKPRCQYNGSERFDRVRHAVAVYRYQFLRQFWKRPRPGHTVQRAAAKLMRVLGQAPPCERNSDRLLALCLKELSRAVGATPWPESGPLVEYKSQLGGLARPSVRRNGQMPSRDGVRAALALLQSSAPRHVLVDAAFDFTKIERDFPGALIWDHAVFRFYLCFVDPLEYFGLLRERIVFQGEDPLREAFLLPEAALRDTVCHYSIDMLTYPYRAGLDTLAAGEFRDLLYGWFLRTLRYFEEGFIDFNYYSLRQYFGNRHSEEVGRFSLLHGIAEELSTHL